MCRVSIGGGEQGSIEFAAVLSTPGVTVDQGAVCTACGGDAQLAEAVSVYMHARCVYVCVCVRVRARAPVCVC